MNSSRFLRVWAIVSLVLASATVTGFSSGMPRGQSFAGTCAHAATVPCSVTPGQRYASVEIGRSGNDDEASVEAVMSDLLGQPVELSPADGVAFIPENVTGAQSFHWSYEASPVNLAFLTVKAADAFAVIGVAGRRAGDVDVSELLGGHDISHVTAWATTYSYTAPVTVSKLYGYGFVGNNRLAEIQNRSVPCVHNETGEVTRCTFTRRSGAWL